MIITKPFIGGYHEDSQMKCFFSTVFIIGSVVYLSYNVDINLFGKLILGIVSLYCIWNQAPIVNSAMPITREDLLIKNRNIGIILSSVFIIIGLIFYRLEVVSNTITWMMIFQALLMFNKRKSNQ
jgi:accessory gene regulator B